MRLRCTEVSEAGAMSVMVDEMDLLAPFWMGCVAAVLASSRPYAETQERRVQVPAPAPGSRLLRAGLQAAGRVRPYLADTRQSTSTDERL